MNNETPRNGRQGLKHWKHDLVAGLVVSLVSLPFSLAIAIASGAPPVTGLISAIIAGLILPFLGGSYVTISGPAAGLAPALLAGMMALGAGNTAVGYPLLLCCICVVGMIQVVLARFKLARLAMVFPTSVVEGMLAAIGLMILVKQLPLLMGVTFTSKSFWGILFEVPRRLGEVQDKVAIIGACSLVSVFVIASFGGDGKASNWRKFAPVAAPIITAALGLALSISSGLDMKYRIILPHSLLDGVTHPNWAGLLSNSSIWGEALKIIVVLTLIDGVESLATIKAIDQKDPFGRRSDANGTLFAMGVSNVLSSLAGGLTIIPGGVKSSTNIVAGGRTQWANGYNAVFLLIFVLFGGQVISWLPLGGLAAIVCFMGYKLCKPAVWSHVASIGKEQLAIFSLTVIVTVSEDLLIGILAGVLAKLCFVVYKAKRTDGGAKMTYMQVLKSCFKNPVKEVDAGVTYKEDGDYEIVLNGPVTCFNSAHLQRAFEKVPKDVKLVKVRCEPHTMLILDHTSAANLKSFQEYFAKKGRGEVILDIESDMELSSSNKLSLRVPRPSLPPAAFPSTQ